jgi:hypothetical protein
MVGLSRLIGFDGLVEIIPLHGGEFKSLFSSIHWAMHCVASKHSKIDFIHFIYFFISYFIRLPTNFLLILFSLVEDIILV